MDAVEEIKSRLSIEDVVERYVDLKRSGSSLKGLCPFHGEKTPSFYVTPSKGIYKCFGCGKSGDVFTFLQEMERVDFPEALTRLAQQANVQLPEREDRRPSLKRRLLESNEAAAAFFNSVLSADGGARARAYLEQRGYGEDAIVAFGLGCAPSARAAMGNELRARGFDDRVLLAAGLVFPEEQGATPRDRFRSRLMFPIRDGAGRVVGFGGRTLGDDQPKYLNSPQTEIFDKSSVLFGIHAAREGIRAAGRAVLVEGYFDAIRAHLHSYTNTVASLGTSVTVSQLAALTRLTGTVVLALDPDPAGQAAAARAAITALAELTKSKGRQVGQSGTVELRIATLPEGRGDPDELIRDHPDMWEGAIESSVPAFQFYFETTMKGLDRSREEWKQEGIDRLLPLIQQFSDSAGWQATWIQRLARETGVDPSLLQRSLPGAHAPAPRRPRQRAGGTEEVVTATTSRGLTADTVDLVERALLSLLLKLIVVPDRAAQVLSGVRFKRSSYQEIVDELLRWRENGNYDYDMFREHLTPPTAELADSLRDDPSPLPPDDKLSVAVGFHLERVRYLSLREEQRTIQEMLGEIDDEGRAAAVATLGNLLRQTFDVERNLERLRQEMFARIGDT